MRVSEKAREMVVLDAIVYFIVMISDKLRKTLGNRDLSGPQLKNAKGRAVTVDAEEQARHDVQYEILSE